jgi:hypothetical protein
MEITTAVTPKTILFAAEPKVAVSVVVGNTGLDADSDGKKILKAGTPLKGDLTARGTAFVKGSETGDPAVSDAVAILLHDVDVTAGNKNAQALVFGFVDEAKCPENAITAAVKAALKGIFFLK